VWRRIVPRTSGDRLVRVSGRSASTLTVFAGKRPTPYDALDCVVRSAYGELQMRVPMKKNRPIWIRIGSDRPPSGATVTLRLKSALDAVVVDGGPGGFDPTAGGPGGGLPGSCARSRTARARVGGARIRGSASARNHSRWVPLAIRVSGSALCDVTLELVGPHGRVYAQRRAVRLAGRQVVRLGRTRQLVRGRYRLRVTAASELGGYAQVRSGVKGRLGK
jgi:hypothetical protein